MKDRSWLFTRKIWSTCSFRGLVTEKQVYLDLLTEKMAEKKFQQVKKEPHGVFKDLLEGRDLLFESPDRTEVSVRAVPSKNGLKVGFVVELHVTRKKAWFWLIGSLILGFFVFLLSAYIIGHGTLPLTNVPWWMVLILTMIFLLPLFGTLSCLRIPEIKLSRSMKKMLAETAESMSGKQISPFKKTTVDLED